MPGPVILQIGALQIRWYGLFAAIAVIATYALLSIRQKKFAIKPDDMTTLLTLCVILGLIGARLEYVRRFWGEYFSDNPLAILRVWEGGLVFQGGFIFAFIGALVFCKIKQWPIGSVADLLAPALPVGHAIARLGCLFNGCCFGMPWNHLGAVHYPPLGNDVLQTQIFLGHLPAEATDTLPVFPIQILETLWCLIVAAVILFCEKKNLLGNFRFFIYVLGYSIGRFFLEFFRGDYHQSSGMTPAQATTAFVIIPATLIAFAICYKIHHSQKTK